MAFVSIEVDDTPDGIADEIYEAIQLRWPDWDPSDGALEKWLVDAWARVLSEVLTLFSTVPEEIFRQFGEHIVNIPPNVAVAASGSTTWTMVDNLGYTVPQNTVILIPATGDEHHAFATIADLVIPPGSTTGSVNVQALEPGDAADGLDGTPELNDALVYVDSVALDAPTAGGVDAEPASDYLGRLAAELQLMTQTPILPSDFEVLARRITGVARAIAIDLWDPVGDTLGNERYVGIVALDEEGADVGAGIKADLEAYLDSLREVNFVAKVGSPTFTAIDVTVTVRCYETFDPAAVDAAVTAALENYLDPAQWGIPPFGDGSAWINTDKVRYMEVSEVVNRVPGVNYVESLSVEGGAVDVSLTGRVPVAQPGTITVTANAGP